MRLVSLAVVLALAGCSGSTPELGTPNIDISIGTDGPGILPGTATSAPTSTSTPARAPAAAGSTAAAPGADGFFACRLPAPVRSDDPCSADADCAPATPCHARACVARAKAHPADATTVCTRQLACDSVDVNRCGCFEGRCSLVPPSR